MKSSNILTQLYRKAQRCVCGMCVPMHTQCITLHYNNLNVDFFFFHCHFCYHLNNSKFQDSHKQKLHKFPLYIIWMLILFLFTIWILRFQTITYSILAQFGVSFMCHSHLQLRLMLPQTYNVRLLQLPFSPGLGFFPFFYSLIT